MAAVVPAAIRNPEIKIESVLRIGGSNLGANLVVVRRH
jgi:hypothetical protein